MDVRAITKLNFFELIGNKNNQTQRSISKALNISLGNTNAILKELVESGFIEVHQIEKNRVQYVLTKKGHTEKSRLSKEYLMFSLSFCSDIKDRIQRVFGELCQQKAQTIVLYGSGELTELAFMLVQKTPLELIGIIDKNQAGQIFLGIPVMHPNQLSSFRYDKVFITDLIDSATVDKIAKTLKIHRDKCIAIK